MVTVVDFNNRASDSRALRRSAAALIGSIARTNVQLYNQLLAQGRPETELAVIRRAYDLTAQLYASAYQADGKPFVTHVVSVASTMALLHMPGSIIATALLHNVYNNGDFGDGRRRHTSAARRRRVVAAVGAEIEALLRDFAAIRIERHIDQLIADAPGMSATERALVTMDLADLLEKHLDGGVLYFGQRDWVLNFAAGHRRELAVLAGALQQPVLGCALGLAIDDLARRQIPDVLRSDYKYLHYEPPLSYWRKPIAALQDIRETRLFLGLQRLKHRLLSTPH